MTGPVLPLGGVRYAFHTFGCQMNENDTERLAGYLEAAGAVPAGSIESADLVVINTCSVRAKSEEKLFSLLGRLRSLKKKHPFLVGVAGCVAQVRKDRLPEPKSGVDFVIGFDQYHRIAEIAAESRHRKMIETSRRRIFREDPVPPVRESPWSGYVTIMEGCDNFCAYCIVPFTRGRERFRPLSAILEEVRGLAAKGFREIQLLGQNVNNYRDPKTGTDFAALLSLVAAVPGPEWVRFLTSHPKNVPPALAEAMARTPKICRQLHLPLQSGSTAVLERMKRGYTRERYLETVRTLRSLMPELRLSADIIVGYPGETEVEFEETLSALSEIRYAGIFSFCYSPRPLTAAAGLVDDIPPEVKRRRLAAVQALQKDIQTAFHQTLLGKVEKVLAVGRSKKDPAVFAGRNEGNQVVNFQGPEDCLGRFVDVEITSVGPYSLRGRMLTR
ncbi:MAG: tRNA (N6-isopentenyl adenosine(37)-C2)-methylthiotransferase MiaB [Candidatus Aminicenantes bacterium]|nr:tRNA (N6-isopentenyl adenosine(37)-C2)-methylthiotransferase MiaB [Candidatus Aminicenantes bacterium]